MLFHTCVYLRHQFRLNRFSNTLDHSYSKRGYVCGDDVYSTNMKDYDAENNLIRVWGPQSWGKYGTFPACIENEKRFGIKFLFEGTQFSYKKI